MDIRCTPDGSQMVVADDHTVQVYQLTSGSGPSPGPLAASAAGPAGQGNNRIDVVSMSPNPGLGPGELNRPLRFASPAGAAALTPASYGGSTIAASATAVRRQDGSVPVGLAMPPYATPASWASPG